MIDLIVSIILYLYTLCLTGVKAWKTKLVTDRAIEGDREREYHVFEDMLAGKWKGIKKHEGVGSSVTIWLFPYLIHRLTRLNPELVFKLFPCFIYSAVPVSIYLIARQFLNPAYSALASFYVLSTFFFVGYNITGRLGVALGFMSGSILALLTGHTLIASVLVILVVVSHYGTTYYMLYVLGASWIALLILTLGVSPDIISISIVLAVLAVSWFVWYRLIFHHVGDVGITFVKSSVLFTSETLNAPVYTPAPDGSLNVRPKGTDDGKSKAQAMTSLENRDPLVQVAFGRTWQYLDVHQKVELFLSWLTVVLMTSGLILSILWMGLTFYIILAIVAFSAIVISVAIPHVSVYYGVAQTYLTSLILLAPCFATGVDALSNLWEVNGYVLGFGIVVLYGLCVSKILRGL